MGAWIDASIVSARGSHLSQFLAVGPANAPASPVGSDVTTHSTATTTNGRGSGLTTATPRCRCWRRSSGAPLGSRCRWIRGLSGDARRGTRWRNSSSTSALTGSSCPRKPAAATASPRTASPGCSSVLLAKSPCYDRTASRGAGRERKRPSPGPEGPGHPLPRARIRERPGNVPLSPPD